MSPITSRIEKPLLDQADAFVCPELSAPTGGWSSLLFDNIIAEVAQQYFDALPADVLRQIDCHRIAYELVSLTNSAFEQRNKGVDCSVQGFIEPLVALTPLQLGSLLVTREGVHRLAPEGSGPARKQRAEDLYVRDSEGRVRNVSQAMLWRLLHEYRPGVPPVAVEESLAVMRVIAPEIKLSPAEVQSRGTEENWARMAERRPEAQVVLQFWRTVRHRFVWSHVPLRFVQELFDAWLAREYQRKADLSSHLFRQALAVVVESDSHWKMDARKQIRTSSHLKEPELLIHEYQLDSWKNPLFQQGDSAEMYSKFDVRSQTKFTGVLIRTGIPGQALDAEALSVE